MSWTEPQEPNKDRVYDHMDWKTPIGRYSIEWKGHKEFNSAVRLEFENWFIGAYDTIDEAKAAALEHLTNKAFELAEFLKRNGASNA